jgi:hypothetical protein
MALFDNKVYALDYLPEDSVRTASNRIKAKQ